VIVSIEVPVFKGGWLQRCIDSVLYQTSPHWRLSLLWDGGDEESRRVLEKLQRRHHPQVAVHFGPNRGIARARRWLSEHSEGDFILPVDDDDALPCHAVERFLEVAALKPWASIIRAQRKMVNVDGKVQDAPPWFPFERRHYQRGMVQDLYNHTHPYLIRRSAYEQTSGWEGFADFRYAGEDCDLYLKLEEVGSIELLDEVLYYYRINDSRASLVLTDEAAFEMWRRLADKTIERIGLPLRRTNDKQPFEYERVPRPAAGLDAVDFIIVTGADESPEAAQALAASLRDAGVPEGALHVEARSVAAVNRVMRTSDRSVACLLDGAARGLGGDALATSLRVMHERELDLAAPPLRAPDGAVTTSDPALARELRALLRNGATAGTRSDTRAGAEPWLHERFLLARREVIRAVGGLDDGYRDVRSAVADFCLKARQRDFRAAIVGAVATDVDGIGAVPVPAPDLQRLRDKWGGRQDLLES
jgi:GT2 family glycosyltransferase